MDEPRISVVIPVWDAYVARLPVALSSVRAQGMPLAVIVVDNASSTPVPAAPGVVTVRMPVRGSAGTARNVGLERVDTPLVCFLDADDELLPGALERLSDGVAGRPTCVAGVAASTAWVEATGEHASWTWPRPLAYRLCRHRRLFAAASLVRNAYPTTGAALLRTDALRWAGGFADGDYEEDWLPAAALAARGHIYLDPVPGRRYRVSSESLYGAGRSFAATRDGRRRLRAAFRGDSEIRRLALALGALLPAAHVLSAAMKARPGRRGHARLSRA